MLDSPLGGVDGGSSPSTGDGVGGVDSELRGEESAGGIPGIGGVGEGATRDVEEGFNVDAGGFSGGGNTLDKIGSEDFVAVSEGGGSVVVDTAAATTDDLEGIGVNLPSGAGDVVIGGGERDGCDVFPVGGRANGSPLGEATSAAGELSKDAAVTKSGGNTGAVGHSEVEVVVEVTVTANLLVEEGNLDVGGIGGDSAVKDRRTINVELVVFARPKGANPFEIIPLIKA